MAGIQPEQYWSNTLRTNSILIDKYNRDSEEEWMRTRKIEFAIFTSTMLLPPMGGKIIEPFKSIKKPTDLYKLPSEEVESVETSAVFNPQRAIEAYNKTSDKKIWHKTNLDTK